jgi:hypothetical protein
LAIAAAISSGLNARVEHTPLVHVVMVPVEPLMLIEVLVLVVDELELLLEELEEERFVEDCLELLDEVELLAAEATPTKRTPTSGVVTSAKVSARRRGDVGFTVVSFRAEWSVQPANTSETD